MPAPRLASASLTHHQAAHDVTESSKVVISKRLVLINSVSGIVTRILTVGVFAWVIQYLLKRVPEEELALLAIVSSLAMALPLLQIILTGGLSRFVTEAYARNDLRGVTRIVSSQFPLLLAGAAIMLLLGGAVAWNIDYILNISPAFVGKARLMMFLIVGRMAIGMAIAPFNTGLYAKQRFVLQNTIDIASSLVRMALMVGFLLLIGPDVEWVVVANIASQLFGQITSTIISMRLLPALRFRASQFDWKSCKHVLSFSGWNFVTESANLIRRAADAPLLNLYSTPIAVNDFYLGSVFESQLRSLAITASQPLMPALTAMHAHEQHDRLAGVFLRGARILLWASMLLAVPLIVFSHDLFSLYLGPKYPDHVNAANIMVILLLTFPFTYPTMMFYRIAYAQGNIRPIAIRAFLSQVANLALTVLLVGWFRMGAIGSATATFISFAIAEPFFNWPLALNSLQIPWRRFISHTLSPGLMPAFVAGCIGVLCIYFIGESSLWRVVVGIPICMLAYGLALLVALRPADRADLARVRRAVGV
jgi:O-antigen/teichoic acid export membrane protein